MGAWFQRVCVFKIKPLAFINTTKSKTKPLLKQIHKLISRNAKVLTQIHEANKKPKNKKTNKTLSGRLRLEPRSLHPANTLPSKGLCSAQLQSLYP